MADTLLDLTYQLTQAGEPFVIATVIWCERPTSAKPGAKAIIQAKGEITGWIGGNRAQTMGVGEAVRLVRGGGGPSLPRVGGPRTGMVCRASRVFPISRG